MKHTTRILLLVLSLILALGLLSGCENSITLRQKLTDVWITYGPEDPELTQTILENNDMYPEELALVDLESLQYAKIVEFREDGTYRFAYDVEQTKVCVREFYVQVLDSLYEGRSTLNDTYETNFDNMSQEEFRQFYADLYQTGDYETLLDELTNTAFDYEVLGEDWETGTYTLRAGLSLGPLTLRGHILACTITGETLAENLGFAVDEETLTLTYADAQEVYTRLP